MSGKKDVGISCIVLAGGRGTRMGASTLRKVCLPVAGVPAINRSIAAYREAGLRRMRDGVGGA